MADEKVVDRVRKLLELSKSDNMNEAGNAAAAAQELMSKHAISQAMLDISPDEDETIENDLLRGSSAKQLETWKGQLGVATAEVNQCRCYRSGSDLRVIGRPSDATTVRYLFSYIVREIDRLAIEGSRERGETGRSWMNNFRLGATQEVCKRLRQADRDARAAMRKDADASDTMGNGVALMRLDNALTRMDEHGDKVDLFGKRTMGINFKRKKRHRSQTRYDAEARRAGARAGASIDISSGGNSKGLGSGARGRLKG